MPEVEQHNEDVQMGGGSSSSSSSSAAPAVAHDAAPTPPDVIWTDAHEKMSKVV